MFSSSTEDVAVLSWAQPCHFVGMAVKLLQDLVPLCVQDVNLPFGWTATHAANPHLVFNFYYAVASSAVLQSDAVERFAAVFNVPNRHLSRICTHAPHLLPLW